MRRIERTTQFKRDFKRELKGCFSKKLESSLIQILQLLIVDAILPEKYKDHQLHGEYSDCRDCHIFPDLILIYKKIELESLQLIRIGSHSTLF